MKDNGLVEYGKKLVELGKKFQNKNTTLNDLVESCYELGLIVSFRVSPDINQSIEITSDATKGKE